MKIYKNPFVSRPCYFIRTGSANSAKNEASKSTGYKIELWDGIWKCTKSQYYNQDYTKFPVVYENKGTINDVINKAIIDYVLDVTGG